MPQLNYKVSEHYFCTVCVILYYCLLQSDTTTFRRTKSIANKNRFTYLISYSREFTHANIITLPWLKNGHHVSKIGWRELVDTEKQYKDADFKLKININNNSTFWSRART